MAKKPSRRHGGTKRRRDDQAPSRGTTQGHAAIAKSCAVRRERARQWHSYEVSRRRSIAARRRGMPSMARDPYQDRSLPSMNTTFFARAAGVS